MTLKRNFNHSQEIDDNGQNSHAGKPKKKITLNFPNGARVELTEENNTPETWKAVDSILIETWLTKEEFKKLYPDIKL